MDRRTMLASLGALVGSGSILTLQANGALLGRRRWSPGQTQNTPAAEVPAAGNLDTIAAAERKRIKNLATKYLSFCGKVLEGSGVQATVGDLGAYGELKAGQTVYPTAGYTLYVHKDAPAGDYTFWTYLFCFDPDKKLIVNENDMLSIKADGNNDKGLCDYAFEPTVLSKAGTYTLWAEVYYDGPNFADKLLDKKTTTIVVSG